MKCDYCGEEIKEDEEETIVVAGDESVTLCEGCAQHYLD